MLNQAGCILMNFFHGVKLVKIIPKTQAYSLTIHKAFCILGNIFATS